MRQNREADEEADLKHKILFYQRCHWIFILYAINLIKELRDQFIGFRFSQIIEKNNHKKITKAQKALKGSLSKQYNH